MSPKNEVNFRIDHGQIQYKCAFFNYFFTVHQTEKIQLLIRYHFEILEWISKNKIAYENFCLPYHKHKVVYMSR